MPDAELAMRILLPGYFLAFVLIGGVLRVARTRRVYGVDPLAVGAPDPVSDVGESIRNVILGAAMLVSVAYAFAPGIHEYLGPVALLERPIMRWTGAVLMVLSQVVITLAQGGLGSSWRFGIDRAHPPAALVTSGLYSLSRNPIYVGMAGAAAGFFLALPNAVTFAILCVVIATLETRIRIEEQFLVEIFGDAYKAYSRRTSRWFRFPSFPSR